MTTFVRSISSSENYEYYGWSQGEFANINNLAGLRFDGTVVSWGHSANLPNDNSGFPISGIVKLYSHMQGYAGLKYDDSVVSWGQHYFDVEMPNDLGDVSKIYTTREAFAALKHDGSVVTWGGAAIGENLGEDSSSVSSSLNGGVIEIVSTYGAFAALKNDGSVVTWGLDRDGGDSSAVSDQLSSGVNKIYSTNYSFAALKNDGSVVTWGFDKKAGQIDYLWGPWTSNGENGNSNILESDVSKVCTMSDGYFAAIKTDGSVVVWGWGAPGVWLESEDSDVIRFIDISDQLSSGVVNIFSTNTAAAALKSDGSVVTWGEKIYGGDSSSVISQISSDVISISTTGYAFAALKSDGSVVTWGENERGGDSSLVSDDLSSGVQKIYGGGDVFAALKDDGSVISWGDYEPISGSGSVTTSWESVKDQLSNGVVDVVHNGQSDAWAALKSDGSVVTWGRNDYGGDSTVVMGPDWTLNGTKSGDQLSNGIAALNNIFTDEIITLYLIKPSSTNLIEGNTLNTTVQTTNLPAGTNIYWSLTGTGIDSSDLTSGDLEGMSELSDNGDFSFSQTFIADGNNEGTENLEIKLFRDSNRSIQLGLTKSIQINDNDTQPTIYGPSGSTGTNSTISKNENSIAVYTFNADEIVTWSTFGGDDQQQFTINSNSGALSFLSAPDYENPNDSNLDNIYSVTIRATDSVNNTADQIINISVENVDETAPTISSFNADNSVVWTSSNIFLNFSEAVDVESGNIVIYKASDDSVVETIDVTSLNKVAVTDLYIADYSYNRIAITRNSILPEISSHLGVSEDSKTNLEWYQELKNNWKMTINGSDYLFVDSSEATRNESLSANDSSWIYLSTNAEFTPDTDVSGSYAATFTNLESKSSYTINPTNVFEESTSYYVQIDATAFDDSSSNSYAGINDKTTLGFTTASDFEALNYIASYADLINYFGIDTSGAISHHLNFGIAEGRSVSLFSASNYLAKYSDLSPFIGDDQTLALKHYILHGYAEGRTDTLLDSGSDSGSSSDLTDFEALNYIASHVDLLNYFGTDDDDIESAKSHYEIHGKAEGRALDNFDEWGYLASNNELIEPLGGDTTEAVKNYISFGYSQGKITNSFDAQSYLNNYEDLRNYIGENQELATQHYVKFGFNEGRVF